MTVPTDPPAPGLRNPNRAGIDFIKTELQTAITLLQLSATERKLPDREAAEKARALAQEAYENFHRFLPTVEKYLTAEELSQIKELQSEVQKLLLPQ